MGKYLYSLILMLENQHHHLLLFQDNPQVWSALSLLQQRKGARLVRPVYVLFAFAERHGVMVGQAVVMFNSNSWLSRLPELVFARRSKT